MTRVSLRSLSTPLLSVTCVSLLLASGCNKSAAPVPAPGANMAAAPSSSAPVTAGSLPSDTLVVPVNNPAGAPLPAPVAAGSLPTGTYVVPATSANSAIGQPAATPPTPAAVAASTPATSTTTKSAAPVERVVAPAPALVVPAGTRVTVVTNQSLSAEHSDPGAGFTGSLAYPIVVRGTTVFGRGTEVRGEITSAKGRGRFKGAGVLGIELTNIGGHSVSTTEYVQRTKGRGKRTAGFIGGGGGIGALIGGLAGGGKGALIGGLSGAGAGTAAGALTGSRDVVIPAESTVSFTTRSSITK